MKNKISVIISREKLGIEALAEATGPSGFTYITEGAPSGLKKRPIKQTKNLSMIVITSPEKMEETPGVMSYLLSTLAAENINVLEFVSCYKDTLLILEEADSIKAFEILSEKMRA